MRVDVLVSFDIDTEKGTVKLAKQEIVNQSKDSKPKSTPKIKDDGSTDPKVVLEDTKISFNTKAAELLGIAWEDRVEIKYSKIQGVMVPVIGKNEAFGTKGGNKVTKTNTVACRGAANDKLAGYGNEFSLIPTEKEGVYQMVGNIERDEPIVKEVDDIKDEDELLEVFAAMAKEDADENTEIDEFEFTL